MTGYCIIVPLEKSLLNMLKIVTRFLRPVLTEKRSKWEAGIGAGKRIDPAELILEVSDLSLNA